MKFTAFLVAAGCACAQTPPSFEVASIRPSSSEDRRPLINMQPSGRCVARNATVKRLITVAYRIKHFQISGGPKWIDSDFFDIAATPAGPLAKPDQFQAMLQALLAERFHLVIRRETKEMPVYALVAAKGGPKIKEALDSDPAIIDPGGRAPEGAPRRPPITRIRRGSLTAQGIEMLAFVDTLSNFLGRAVLDRTGLSGRYDVKLQWTTDENQVAMFEVMGVPEGFGAPPPDPLGPSLFTALQEQLGLRLETQKGPLEMLVIERVEKPSEN